MAYAQWLSLLAGIADAADVIAMHYFRSHALEVQEKPDASPVTGADLEIEQAARRIARERCPELGVCGEEYGETRGSAATRLIIDFDLAPWDIAALAIIVEEAGGRATDVNGKRTIHAGSFVASNGLLHEAVITALARG